MNKGLKLLIYLIFFVILGLVLGKSGAIKSYFQNVSSSPTPKTAGEIAASPSEGPSPKPTISEPSKISIPKIKVSAAVESVGLDKDRKMDIPKNDIDTAWYNLGVKPGEKGNAVLDGHLDTKTGAPAVFWSLDKLTSGDEITITSQDAKTYTYKVVSVNTYDDATFPLQEVFGDTDKSRLNLITCAGVYNTQAKNYSKRVVVYSELEQ